MAACVTNHICTSTQSPEIRQHAYSRKVRQKSLKTSIVFIIFAVYVNSVNATIKVFPLVWLSLSSHVGWTTAIRCSPAYLSLPSRHCSVYKMLQPRCDHETTLSALIHQHWLPVQFRIHFKLSTIMYCIRGRLVPAVPQWHCTFYRSYTSLPPVPTFLPATVQTSTFHGCEPNLENVRSPHLGLVPGILSPRPFARRIPYSLSNNHSKHF